jgi:hypothetical protein
MYQVKYKKILLESPFTYMFILSEPALRKFNKDTWAKNTTSIIKCHDL